MNKFNIGDIVKVKKLTKAEMNQTDYTETPVCAVCDFLKDIKEDIICKVRLVELRGYGLIRNKIYILELVSPIPEHANSLHIRFLRGIHKYMWHPNWLEPIVKKKLMLKDMIDDN